jgi:Raf kinase inhibitor-like YbhB/YbcL family protein
VPARFVLAVATVVTIVTVVAACDTDDGKTMRPPTNSERAAMPTTTTATTITAAPGATGVLGSPGVTGLPGGAGGASTASAALTVTLPWADGGAIDTRFTCDGADTSPQISWTAPPAGTVELALLVVDDDAGGYVHWAVAGIPPAAGETPEGEGFPGALEGINSFGKTGYGGPCPPSGATHTYRFTLYALGQQSELPDGFTGQDLETFVEPTAIAVAEVLGTYTRAG